MRWSLSTRWILALLFATAWVLPPTGAQQSDSRQAQPSQSPTSTAKAKPNPKKQLLDDDLKGFDLSPESNNVRTVVGGTRGGGPQVTLLAPKIAKLFGSSALFQWSAKGSSEGFVFTVLDDDELPILEEQTRESSFALPAKLSKLSPGETYEWRVRPRALPPSFAGGGLKFTVVSEEERLQIEKEIAAIPSGDPFDSSFARARVFVSHHLWFDAIGAYTDLIARFPTRAEPFEDRGAIYLQNEATKDLGRIDLAKAHSMLAAQSN
jgi:hypothetical protein